MTTLEFMEKQLIKQKINLSYQMKNNVPEEVIQNISEKIRHYEIVVEMLKG